MREEGREKREKEIREKREYNGKRTIENREGRI